MHDTNNNNITIYFALICWLYMYWQTRILTIIWMELFFNGNNSAQCFTFKFLNYFYTHSLCNFILRGYWLVVYCYVSCEMQYWKSLSVITSVVVSTWCNGKMSAAKRIADCPWTTLLKNYVLVAWRKRSRWLVCF